MAIKRHATTMKRLTHAQAVAALSPKQRQALFAERERKIELRETRRRNAQQSAIFNSVMTPGGPVSVPVSSPPAVQTASPPAAVTVMGIPQSVAGSGIINPSLFQPGPDNSAAFGGGSGFYDPNASPSPTSSLSTIPAWALYAVAGLVLWYLVK